MMFPFETPKPGEIVWADWHVDASWCQGACPRSRRCGFCVGEGLPALLKTNNKKNFKTSEMLFSKLI